MEQPRPYEQTTSSPETLYSTIEELKKIKLGAEGDGLPAERVNSLIDRHLKNKGVSTDEAITAKQAAFQVDEQLSQEEAQAKVDTETKNTLARSMMMSGSPFAAQGVEKIPAVYDALSPENKRLVIEAAIAIPPSFLPFPGTKIRAATAIGRLGYAALRTAVSSMAAGGGSLVAEIVDPTESPLKTAGTAMAVNAIGEGVASAGLMAANAATTGIVKAITGASEGGSSGLVEGAETAMNMLNTETGQTISISQAFDTSWARFLNSYGESGIFSQGAATEGVRRGEKQILENIDNFTDTYVTHLGPEAVGDILQRGKERGIKAFRAETTAAAAELDSILQPELATIPTEIMSSGKSLLDRIKNALPVSFFKKRVVPVNMIKADTSKMVNNEPLKEYARKELAKLNKVQLKSLSPQADKAVLEEILDMPQYSLFQDAQATRSKVINQVIVRKGGKEIGTTSTGNMQQISKIMSDQMDETAGKIGGEFLEKYKAFNKAYKDGRAKWTSRYIESFGKRHPTEIAQSFKGAPVEDINSLMGVMDDEAKMAIRGSYIGDILNPDLATPRGKSLLAKFVKEGGGKNRQRLEAVFGKEKAKTLVDLARSLGVIQQANQGGKFGMQMTFLNMGALGGVGTGIAMSKPLAVAGSATVLLSPNAIARMLTANPKAIRNLIEASKLIQQGKYHMAEGLTSKFLNAATRAGALGARDIERLSTREKEKNSTQPVPFTAGYTQ